MSPKEIVFQMLSLQQSLNDETNGLGWESGYNKHGKIISWRRCIYMECAELIDSFAWKHWKNIDAQTNWQNVTVECVDIWHFVMSLLLENYKSQNKSLEELAEDIANTHGFKEFCGDALSLDERDNFTIINNVESLIHISTGFKIDLFDGLLREFFELLLSCGVNLDELYKIYAAKNILNRFRQNHGYKDGSYIKIWNGKEDNVVMLEVLENTQSMQECYVELEKIYKTI